MWARAPNGDVRKKRRPGTPGEQGVPGREADWPTGGSARAWRGVSATPGRLSAVLALVAGAASNGQPAATRTGGRIGCGIESSIGGRFRGGRGRVSVRRRRIRRRELHDAIQKLELWRGIGDLSRPNEAERCPLRLGKEAVPQPAEDVVDDRLRETNLGIAGPTGWLEAHVTELFDKVRERDAVLEQQRNARGERVHHPGERRALLRHGDEQLAGRVVLEEP